MQEFTTYHGKAVKAQTGQYVVMEYRKGFLNDVRVFGNKMAAVLHKENKVAMDAYTMQKVFHWSIQEVK